MPGFGIDAACLSVARSAGGQRRHVDRDARGELHAHHLPRPGSDARRRGRHQTGDGDTDLRWGNPPGQPFHLAR